MSKVGRKEGRVIHSGLKSEMNRLHRLAETCRLAHTLSDLHRLALTFKTLGVYFNDNKRISNDL